MKNFSFTLFMMRVLFSLVGIGFGLFPNGLYFLARYAFSPEGFWQNLILAGGALFFLGFLQIILVILTLVWLYHVWLGPDL